MESDWCQVMLFIGTVMTRDSHIWNEIEPESDAEFMEDYGLIEEVTFISGDNTINSIDCYRHFITDDIVDLVVHETNR